MNTFGIPEEINHERRRLFGTVAMTIAAAQLGIFWGVSGSAEEQFGDVKAANLRTIKTGVATTFGSLKRIDAGLLNVGYVEAGPADGPPVILLHGWPDDIHSFVDVAPLLASAGYRVIPYLRRYGTTSFLSRDPFRNGQQSVVALDIIALIDALKIQKAIIAGFDTEVSGRYFRVAGNRSRTPSSAESWRVHRRKRIESTTSSFPT